MKRKCVKIINAIKKILKIDHDVEQKGIKATRHGMINNLIYVLRTTRKLNSRFLFLLIVGSVARALYTLVGIYLPKIALELVEKQYTIDKVIITMAIVGIIILTISAINTYSETVGSWEFDKVQYKLMGKYLNKVFSTDFCNMENPDFLDLTQRAVNANYYNVGFHGYCMRARLVISGVVLVVIEGIAVAAVNPILIIVLMGISWLIYKILDDTMEWAKLNVDDALAENYRKRNYFANTAKDFRYAKEIRLFRMADWIEHLWEDVNSVFYLVAKKTHDKWILCEAKMSLLRLIQNVILYAVLTYCMFYRGMSIANFVLYIGLIASFSETMTDLFSNFVWMNMNKLQMDDYRTFIDWEESKPNRENGEASIKILIYLNLNSNLLMFLLSIQEVINIFLRM